MTAAASPAEALRLAPCGLLTFADDGEVVFANEALAALLGADAPGVPPLVGRSVESLMPLATRLFYQTHLAPMLRLHGRLDEIDVTLRAVSGADVPVLVNAVRRESASGVQTHCAVFAVARRRQFEAELLEARRRAEGALAETRTVTEHLGEALAQLRAAQDQLVHEEKLAGLGRMATAVAHEVRNPLTFVVGFASLAGELLGELHAHLAAGEPGGRGETLAVLTALEQNAARTAHHSRRVDAIVGRMTTHAAAAGAARTDVNAVAQAAVAALTAERQADVVLALAPDAGEVHADADALADALAAVLDNALDAVEDRATWDDAFEARVTLCTRRAPGAAVVEVADTGGGISEADRVRVLEPFFTTRGPTSGHAGLGLPRAYETVRRHGGTLAIAGGAGGTTVCITLPALA